MEKFQTWRKLKLPSLLDGTISRQDIADLASIENLILDDDDRIGVLESTESIDVQACPGSGKTTLIAAKLILLAKKWPFEDRGICVLSHTNVAKDEIIRRLKKPKTVEAQNLLSYPHFIGTIQEFIGKYVAFPMLRSDGTKINMVDTDICVGLIYSKLRQRTRAYIDLKSQHSNVLFDFDLDFGDGNITVNVPTFPNGSNSESYQDLLSTRQSLISDGYFFYRDVFCFAQKALFENEALLSALQRRFPCVFLDEMQDTQKFQDELLCKIFPLDRSASIVQRFGDPDQAIFHGFGSEEPNESFNGKSEDDMDVVIDKSHRFDDGIASKIAKLSFNKVSLGSELSEKFLGERRQLQANQEGFEHTIFIFQDDNISQVIPAFVETVSRQFSAEHMHTKDFSVKAVGAVGNEITQEGQLKIGHYWPDFDKEKSNKNFREKSLIEAVYYCRQRADIDWAASYKLLSDCVLRFLRSANIRDPDEKYFNATTLREHLTQNGNWVKYRKLIHFWLNPAYELNQGSWKESNCVLSAIFDLDGAPAEVGEYLAFHEPQAREVEADGPRAAGGAGLVPLPDNMIQHPAGFAVELSTIHGVKGETHDATLILETKNHCFDLGTMLPYVVGNLPSQDHPNTDLRLKPSSRAAFKPNRTFMRQFYVGMSRPKHLLCLAVHADRICQEQKAALTDVGWRVHELAQGAG